ncbi:acyclic terpene utilization AtuA family protein [Halalkalicoccus tibetensis]|uniref:Acyclic terpene utilization AtuA family protein n=1 Tax=Halalkalicoccus tibetensis TaxID=175632 RepID=A0ABD5VBE2_9EURY
MSDTTLQIGAGAGYSGDRIDPAVELSEYGDLDYLVFECLAERTIALAQLDRLENPDAGYNSLLEERLRAVVENCLSNEITIVSNMGAANVEGAVRKAAEIVQETEYDAQIAGVSGSDVLDAFGQFQSETFGGESIHEYENEAVSADAYLGADGIVKALENGADIVLTGRVADPSLFLAPMLYEFGWQVEPLTNSELIGQGIVAAHLLECAGQVTGGYFADPGYKDVAGLDQLGFPIGEVSESGEVTITKLPNTGGVIDTRTCTEQLLYEVHDPSEYITPDAVADFSHVKFTEVEQDRVEVTRADAEVHPETLKVSVGYIDSHLGEGQISYAGPGATKRAELAEEIVRKRLEDIPWDELHVDHIGRDSLHGDRGRNHDQEPYEVRLRVAAKCPTQSAAKRVAREVQTLYTNGPAGGGGATMKTQKIVGIVSTLIDRTHVEPQLLEVQA